MKASLPQVIWKLGIMTGTAYKEGRKEDARRLLDTFNTINTIIENLNQENAEKAKIQEVSHEKPG